MDDTDWSDLFPDESTNSVSETPKKNEFPMMKLISMDSKKLPIPIWYKGDKGKVFHW